MWIRLKVGHSVTARHPLHDKAKAIAPIEVACTFQPVVVPMAENASKRRRRGLLDLSSHFQLHLDLNSEAKVSEQARCRTVFAL